VRDVAHIIHLFDEGVCCACMQVLSRCCSAELPTFISVNKTEMKVTEHQVLVSRGIRRIVNGGRLSQSCEAAGRSW